jgi:hypothetical protein
MSADPSTQRGSEPETWTVWGLAANQYEGGWYPAKSNLTEEVAKMEAQRCNERKGRVVFYVATPPAVYPWD